MIVFLPACHSYRYDHHTRLLPYVLNAIADEAKVSGVIYIHHAMLRVGFALFFFSISKRDTLLTENNSNSLNISYAVMLSGRLRDCC